MDGTPARKKAKQGHSSDLEQVTATAKGKSITLPNSPQNFGSPSAQFHADFPHDADFVRTEGTQMDSALVSICNSITVQAPFIPAPGPFDLLCLIKTGPIRAMIKQTHGPCYNDEEFDIHLVAAVLEMYGRCHGAKLKLGLILEKGGDNDSFLVVPSTGALDWEEWKTIWVRKHDIFSDVLGHYCGLVREEKMKWIEEKIEEERCDGKTGTCRGESSRKR